jgi:hypothetical protein
MVDDLKIALHEIRSRDSMELDTELSEILPASWMGQVGLYTYGGTDALAGVELFGGAVFSREFGL